ncbi:hypothetical protein GUJ93_ZPchr0003g17266 [Zizania palustris]|uniref:Uncharacterized protein n=1 Tax=Zizania palustris TaxID=103762 RepID=A0A8J5SV97_ZIZPA|nr:hypothetical protein GUJ93_ZPchr0003g17266 [Zizania palustris]
MASSSSKKLSLTFILLVAGVIVLGETGATGAAADCAAVRCIQGGYITCKNYPGKKFDGCICQCAPRNGEHCVLHLQNGSSTKCRKPK